MALTLLEEISKENSNSSPKTNDFRSQESVNWAIRSAVMTKQYGYVDELTSLISRACVAVCPQNPRSFNVDHVRSVKVGKWLS